MKLKGLARTLVPERIPWFAVDLYSQIAATTFTSYYQRVSSEILAEMNCGRILDIGSGPGYLPIEIARKASAITADGIDLKWGSLTSRITTPYTLEQAYAIVSASKFKHYETQTEDGLRIRLRKGK